MNENPKESSNDSNIFNIPKIIKIEEHTCNFKDSLINDYYTYRCKFRKDCGLVIKISKIELQKYMNDNKIKPNYIITGEKKVHTCENENERNNKDDNIINDNQMDDNKNNELLIKSMIIHNISKPLKFHIENFKNNNINLSYNQVKWRLQKYREENFPNDNDYLKDISKIIISFEAGKNLENLPFCYKVVNMINSDNNTLDKYIIFTSKLQMNLLQKCSQILIDGTFKSCPSGFYKVINIAGYYKDINSIIPIFMIPSTGKTFKLYNSILEDVKKILKENQINEANLPNRIIIDFEKGLQKAVRLNFPNSIIDGCYFHFVKLLWSKSKKLGLCKKMKYEQQNYLYSF